jgi:hypothetical protein
MSFVQYSSRSAFPTAGSHAVGPSFLHPHLNASWYLTLRRSRKGMSMAAFNPFALGVHAKVNENKAAAEMNKST